MDKARKSTFITKMNYAGAPRFSPARSSNLGNSGGGRPGPSGLQNLRREPAPPNDNNVFGRPPTESPKVRLVNNSTDRQGGSKVGSNSFFKALAK
jgi:hypothetical protein